MSDFFSFLPIYPTQLLILTGKLILGQVHQFWFVSFSGLSVCQYWFSVPKNMKTISNIKQIPFDQFGLASFKKFNKHLSALYTASYFIYILAFQKHVCN